MAGCNVINLGICPKPVIMYEKEKLKIPAGIIISGSQNIPEGNALKLFSSKTYLDEYELVKLVTIFNKIDLNEYNPPNLNLSKLIQTLDGNTDYIKVIHGYFNINEIKNKNNLRVVIDPGAGAGKYTTPQILEGLGCKVKVINKDFKDNNEFPRVIEPIKQNLRDLILTVWKEKFDIGFAHDCDADRLSIIGDDYKCYMEDMGVALIANYYLENHEWDDRKVIFLTNLASSLVFDMLAEEYKAEVILVRIGERNLAEIVDFVMNKMYSEAINPIIIGCEGFCGGMVYPYLKNGRDGFLLAAKLVEIMVETGEKFSTLISRIPNFYSWRENIDIVDKDIESIIRGVKEELISEGEKVIQVDFDLRIGVDEDWFVLIHPSNSKQIIKVISEAKRESLARIYCQTITGLVKSHISNNYL